MRLRRALGGVLLFSTIGCHPPMAPLEPSPPPSPVVVTPRPPEPEPELADRCEALQAESPDPPRRRFCVVTASGHLWAIEIDGDDAALVVHEDPAGHRAGATFRGQRDQGSPSYRGEEAAQVFDFDGDGDPELFFTLISAGYEDRVVRRVFVTVQGDQVVPYRAAPPGVDELRDVDSDGRPDALVHVDVGGTKGCEQCTGAVLHETFVAHAQRDGTFSFTDDTARAHVRERCPTRPRGPVVGRDESVSLANVLCSRIWGVPTATLVTRLRVQCASHAAESARCQGPCRHLELLEAAALLDPLTRL